MNIALVGATGFVGTYLCEALTDAQHSLTILTRRRIRARALSVLPAAEIVECDVYDAAALTRHFAGCDAVINLAGILHEAGANTFQRVHVELTHSVLEACNKARVKRYLHMSALGVQDNAPSKYLRSKWEAEALVRAAKGIGWTIFRPSVVFGRGDSFVSLFAQLIKLGPIIPLACPDTKFQPVWVEDVARAFAHSLAEPATIGQTYELGGPRVYTLKQIVRFVCDTLDKPRAIIGLPDGLSRLQAGVLGALPIKLMTLDNVRSMQVPNVCQGEWPRVFGFQPASMEAIVPAYLSDDSPRGRYNAFRTRAGR